jgi:hypothetical protein
MEGKVADLWSPWASDAEASIRKVGCPVLALCVRDAVLFEHLENVKKAKEGNTMVEDRRDWWDGLLGRQGRCRFARVLGAVSRKLSVIQWFIALGETGRYGSCPSVLSIVTLASMRPPALLSVNHMRAQWEHSTVHQQVRDHNTVSGLAKDCQSIASPCLCAH